jgi:hypothetical protein
MGVLIIKKARVEHVCGKCNSAIKVGEQYYGEDPKINILAGIHKKYCINCYGKENN